MTRFILGKKKGMSQVFDEKGNIVPITIIEAGPCTVTQIKTKEKDGYSAFQLGFGKIEKKNKIRKPMKGKEFRYLKEFRLEEPKIKESLKKGDLVNAAIFKEGDRVKISGISKGKGFQGAVKRWKFHGKNATHGSRHDERTLGSVGTSFPQRVIKGKKMPGRMGSERVTVQNLRIAKIDPENNILAVRGAIPGRNGALVEIRDY